MCGLSKFEVCLLGRCSITYNDKRIDSTTLNSKKIWIFLSYLIINRNRHIPQAELIDIVYSDSKSGNPTNALKTLAHRARAVLTELCPCDDIQIIKQTEGGYKWNSSVPITLDIEAFEYIYKCYCSECNESQRLNLCYKGIDLYCGDFMDKYSFETWIIPINAYYKTHYIHLVSSAIEILSSQNKHEAIIAICRNALCIAPYCETMHYNLMYSLFALGHSHEAMEKYEYITKLFYDEFGVCPSAELQELYAEIAQKTNSRITDIGLIKNQLTEDNAPKGAIFCEYEFFKDIYCLEIHSSERTGRQSHICLLTLAPKIKLPELQMSSAAENLIMCVKSSLRRGDIFAQYSKLQLILLLPNTSFENSEHVISRIFEVFKNYKDFELFELQHILKQVGS